MVGVAADSSFCSAFGGSYRPPYQTVQEDHSGAKSRTSTGTAMIGLYGPVRGQSNCEVTDHQEVIVDQKSSAEADFVPVCAAVL